MRRGVDEPLHEGIEDNGTVRPARARAGLETQTAHVPSIETINRMSDTTACLLSAGAASEPGTRGSQIVEEIAGAGSRRPDTQLRIHVIEVGADRARGQHQLLGDLPVTQTPCRQPHDLALLGGQLREWIGLGG